MANPSVQWARNRLTVGRDFSMTVEIDPPEGTALANSDVVTMLTGATATAVLVDRAGTSVVANGSIGKTIDASARTLTLTIADTVMDSVSAGWVVWQVYVTASGGDEWPIAIGAQQVFAL
jgi:hypothetical protein